MKNFVPKPYHKDPVTIRIDIETLEQIDKWIALYGLNRSEFINRCIDFALENMDFEQDGKRS